MPHPMNQMSTRHLLPRKPNLAELLLWATGTDPKPWLIDSGCTGHFCPNKSQFVSYVPYAVKCKILLGDACSTPSIGEGTVRLTCIMGEKVVTQLIHNVQYIPGLKYGLLSCRALLCRGLKVVLENDTCKVFHKDSTLIAESALSTTQLFCLNTVPDDPTQLAIDLIHKCLVHPRKDTLEEMI